MNSTHALLARRDQAMGAGTPLFYSEPLHLVRGDGVYLYDPSGRRYVDMYNNVPCVGHANPRVVEAMMRAQGGCVTRRGAPGRLPLRRCQPPPPPLPPPLTLPPLPPPPPLPRRRAAPRRSHRYA